MKPVTVNIYEYLDYRSYMSDSYEELKSINHQISLEMVGRKLGISKVAVKYVLDQKRHIAQDRLIKYAQLVGLDVAEQKYLQAIFLFSKAKQSDERAQHLEKILKLQRSPLKEQVLESGDLGFYQEWYYPVIAEMSYTKGFSADPFEIQKRLRRPVAVHEIRKAVAYLKKRNFLKNQARMDTKAKVPNGLRSEIIDRYIRHQLDLCKQKTADCHEPDGAFFNVCISVDKEKFQLAKEKIRHFRHELHDLLANTGECDRVVQINMQMFTIADGKDTPDEKP